MKGILIAVIILLSVVIWKLEQRNGMLKENVRDMFNSLHRCDSTYLDLIQQINEVQHNRVGE